VNDSKNRGDKPITQRGGKIKKNGGWCCGGGQRSQPPDFSSKKKKGGRPPGRGRKLKKQQEWGVARNDMLDRVGSLWVNQNGLEKAKAGRGGGRKKRVTWGNTRKRPHGHCVKMHNWGKKSNKMKENRSSKGGGGGEKKTSPTKNHNPTDEPRRKQNEVISDQGGGKKNAGVETRPKRDSE